MITDLQTSDVGSVVRSQDNGCRQFSPYLDGDCWPVAAEGSIVTKIKKPQIWIIYGSTQLILVADSSVVRSNIVAESSVVCS